MPWLEEDTPASVTDALANRKLASWPEPNTERIDARFRHTYGTLAPSPRAERFLWRMQPSGPGGTIFNAWLDVVATSDTTLEGDTGFEPGVGWKVFLKVTNFIDPAVDPTWSKHGIEYRWRITIPSNPDWEFWTMYDKDATGRRPSGPHGPRRRRRRHPEDLPWREWFLRVLPPPTRVRRETAW